MKKRFFFVLLMSLCFISAFAEGEFIKFGNFEYRVLEDGTAEITDYTGSEKRVVVPDTLDGYKVTEIGDDAFDRCYSAESITLPDGIRRIGHSAFYNCQFRSFTIPEGVTEIGNSAFNSCYSLESLVVPDSVTSIGRYAFSGCGDVVLPDTITRIEEGTFSECTFTEITLPSNLTYLGNAVFSCNPYLTQVSIPAGVTTILGNTFYSCDSLTSVILPNTVRVIKGYAFRDCVNLEKVYIPQSVTVIDTYAFDDSNPDVTIICEKGSIAESFAREEGFAFEYPTTEEEEMRKFSYMVNPDDTLTVTGYNGKNTEIAIPAFIDDVPVTAVAPASFVGLSSLTSITLPDTLTEIGEYAFLGCKSLESVMMPDTLTEIGNAVCAYCPNLTLKVADNSKAHQYALENSMKFEIMPSLPSEPDYSEFVTSENEDGTLSITAYTGDETNIVVPSSISGKEVTALSDMVFTSTQPFVSVTLPEGLVSIGDFCFLGSQTLETLVIPASVTEIGSVVGMHCPHLECVVVENSYAHEYVVNNGIPFVFPE